jgi:hypothetical protein
VAYELTGSVIQVHTTIEVKYVVNISALKTVPNNKVLTSLAKSCLYRCPEQRRQQIFLSWRPRNAAETPNCAVELFQCCQSEKKSLSNVHGIYIISTSPDIYK